LVPGQRPLRGVAQDLTLLRGWLESNSGGAWESDEILTLNDPGQQQLRKHIEYAGAADYAFVAFSGHGFAVDHSIEGAQVCILDGDIPIGSILPAAARCTVIIDACRTLEVPDVLKKARDVLGGIEEDLVDRTDYRALFDLTVQMCERGRIVMTSCAADEAAAETPSGGLFTRSLVLSAEAWARKNKRGKLDALSMSAAFDAAASLTSAHEPQPHPEYIPGRRRRHFPFAVSPA
jgi:hypothetical protein